MSSRKFKLLLINPINPENKGFTVNQGQRYPPLGLGIVASLTPENWEVQIRDEVFNPLDLENEFIEADLVGIGAFTFSAKRAYDIASFYKGKGIPTVMGGIHASMTPGEARQYVDVVVIGEAEGCWKELIRDFEEGKMKSLYEGGITDLSLSPRPRHDLFHPGYWFSSIQTTRGCPMNCTFCSVTAFNGKKHRLRPVSEVLDEIASIKKKMIFFVDDNIIGYGKEAREHALAIFRGMKQRKLDKVWFSQASLNFADDPEVLKAASDAGCRMILLGIESEKAEQLKLANKGLNLKRLDTYGEVFRKIHQHSISVLGTFILGLEGDNQQSLLDRAKYMIDSSVDAYQVSVLTPLPGTKLYNDFLEQGRLIKTNYPDDWNHYQFTSVVYHPASMRHDELHESTHRIWHDNYNLKIIRKKAFKTFWQQRRWNLYLWFTRGFQATMFAYYTNWHFMNATLGKKEKK